MVTVHKYLIELPDIVKSVIVHRGKIFDRIAELLRNMKPPRNREGENCNPPNDIEMESYVRDGVKSVAGRSATLRWFRRCSYRGSTQKCLKHDGLHRDDLADVES